jgi:outer membrane biosynthesis protein TonB
MNRQCMWSITGTLTAPMIIAVLFASPEVVYAGSNNGYTTGANLYTGSTSRTWYGGGVDYVLGEWRKEADMAAAEQSQAVPGVEQAPAANETTTMNDMNEPAQAEEVGVDIPPEAPEQPAMPEKPAEPVQPEPPVDSVESM